jgi:hypothetical protein
MRYVSESMSHDALNQFRIAHSELPSAVLWIVTRLNGFLRPIYSSGIYE